MIRSTLCVWSGTPKALIRKGCHMVQEGQANPEFFNDGMDIWTALGKGCSMEEARGWDCCTRCLGCTRFCYAGALRPAARLMSSEESLQEVEKDFVFCQETGGGMTVSGGELLLQTDFAVELAGRAA